MSDADGGQAIILRDGRRLGYAEYGSRTGRPLFFFHGFPNSRVLGRLFQQAAARRGVRIIALDRPGFGLSDFMRGRTLAGWPDDVVEAADALG
ncbi:MAG: alpha/beta hydrolase, partial [Chloroflexi bacterium]|nr:alpha/beta hydrolase [Chloroflexota bacterium]